MESTTQTDHQEFDRQEKDRKEAKTDKFTADPPQIRVQLPRETAIKVQQTLLRLKERKADTKADDLLASYLEKLTDDYLEEQVELRTPVEFYFEAAKNIPELREKIVREAKKLLGKSGAGAIHETTGESRKKESRKRKESSEEVNILNTSESLEY
jgi:hypothetical protein